MSTTTERDYIPCGGCGSTTPLDRCIGCFHDFGRGRKRKETPPAEPAPLNNLFACPTCNGWHFNISRGGTLVCTSRGNVGTVGCGWRGSLEQPHPDSLRLDWLDQQRENVTLWDGNPDHEEELVGCGWRVDGPHYDVRAAIDAAMSAPSATKP